MPRSRAPAKDRLLMLRATAHPLRLRILSLTTGAAMSATEVAGELEITQANASYHLRRLERAGLVSVVEEVPIRGGVARRYRHLSSTQAPPGVAGAHDAGADLREARVQLDRLLAAELLRRSASRDDGPSASTDAELWLSAEDWQEVIDLFARAAARLHEVAIAPRSQGAVRVSATAALFVMAKDGA